MTISAGSRLGPYEVISPLGAGGMGEVWRARDTRLGRDVAVKVLPAGVASDANRVRRFEKEARSASALNHPNIVTIYDVGVSDSASWIAMEHVEGKTLRELLLGGHLPIRKLLPIAAQIAEGLARAHEASIVHRDLKPENVMVTKDGLVKILDFGLAKLTQVDAAALEGTTLPMETGTSPGVVLGTVGYMSPEQAVGEPADFRSDQFAFGSIVYEMASGKRAFQRASAAQTLAAIIQDEPEPIVSLNPKVPSSVRWIVERCLAKEARARYASTDDLARDLATIRDHLSEASDPALADPGLRRRSRRAVWYVALAAVLLAGSLGMYLARGRRAEAPPVTFTRLTFRRGSAYIARFAPDGQTVIYGGEWEGKPKEIFQTRPGSPESRSFDLSGVSLLAVSNAGEMAIQRGQTLARMPLTGGAPRDLVENVNDADWSPDGKQLAILKGRPGELDAGIRLEYPIGRVVYESSAILCPRVSPDGQRVAFDEGGGVHTVEPDGKVRTLTTGWKVAAGLAWSPEGKEVWFSAARVGFAQQIYGVDLSGNVRTVAAFPGGASLFDVSRSGWVLLARDNLRFQISGRLAGSTQELDYSWLDNSMAVDLSADGRLLLFREAGEGGGGTVGTYLRHTDQAQAVRLGDGFPQALSPDGKWALVFTQTSPSRSNLALLPTGAGEPNVLEEPALDELLGASFFPDGRRIAVFGRVGKSIRGYAFSLQSRKAEPFTPEGFGPGPISPDGKWILLRQVETRKWFLLPLPGTTPRPVQGLDDIVEPSGPTLYPSSMQWSADSRSLFVHRHGRGSTRVLRVDVQTGRQDPWLTIAPLDAAGVWGAPEPILTPDGKSYVYSYIRNLNDLYLVEGLR